MYHTGERRRARRALIAAEGGDGDYVGSEQDFWRAMSAAALTLAEERAAIGAADPRDAERPYRTDGRAVLP